MTEPYLTMAEIEKKYDKLWVFMVETKHDRRHRLLGGRVVLSHPDKAEFSRLWMAWEDENGRTSGIATLYMGSFPVEEPLSVESEPGAA